MFGGAVEMDETYVGGRYDKRRHADDYLKQPFMGIVQRENQNQARRKSARFLFPIALAK